MVEAELVKTIEFYLKKYHLRYKTEIRMGIGVPDVVINFGASKRMTLIDDYYLLAICEHIEECGKIQLGELLKFFSIDKSKMATYLNQLLIKNIVISNKESIYLKKKILKCDLGKTISIEAKIKDWKGGILQAQRYLNFSDYSYLALPEEKIKNVNIAYAQEQGIGLISVTSNGGLQEIIHPKASMVCDYKQKYLVTSAIIAGNMNIVKRIHDPIFSKL